MPKLQKGPLPRVLVNNTVSFLGLNLSTELTLNGFEVVSKQAGHPCNFSIYLVNNLIGPLEEVGRFKEFLDGVVTIRSPLILVTAAHQNPTDIFIEHLLRNRRDFGAWTIVRLPPVLGAEASLESLGILGYFLKSARAGNDLVVPGDGLTKIPYLNYYDAVNFLVTAVKTTAFPKQQTIKVLPAEILSELEVAYLIKSLVRNRNLKVTFGPGNTGVPEPSFGVETITLAAAIPLRESLREMLSTPYERPQVIEEPKLSVTTSIIETAPVQNRDPVLKRSSGQSRFKKILPLIILGVVIAAMLIFIVYPLGKTAYFGLSGKRHLENAISSLSNLNFNQGAIESHQAEEDLLLAQDGLNALPNFEFISGPKKFLQGGELLAGAFYNVNLAALPFTKSTTSFAEVTDATSKMQSAVNDINLAFAFWKGSNTTYEKTLNDYLPKLSLINNALPMLPTLLGYDAPKTYLILFQNPTELRATGGFIGSYAKVTFDQGKMSSLLFDDIYNPDGQLDVKNLAAPVPPEMKVAFPTMQKLHIRDSNFWVSFPTSAKTISDLYTLATGEKVDGVAAIDLSFVSKLLDVAGPVYLGTYDETIGSNNLFERTQFHSEVNYFEGSPQKKNFLQLLGNTLLQKLSGLSTTDKLKILPAIASSLTEKHLMLTTFDQSRQILAENKWDGRVEATAGIDSLMIVDTNTGGNKANYWVQQGASYEVKNTYRQGSLEGFLTINYTNTSKSGSWPSGDYSDYVRIYVPKDTFLNDASSQLTPGDASTPTKPVISVGTESGFTVFGYSFVLPASGTLALKLHYTLPKELNLTGSTRSYELKVLKQPGVVGEPFSFQFDKPFGRNPSVPTGFKAGTDNITYQTLLKSDQDLQIPLN